MDHPRPGLRYVDADDLDDSTVDFDGLKVESRTGEKLGDVDGFIMDITSARPLYVVVDASGWFTSKYFLLPVGHAGLDTDGNRLVADISRDRVSRFPGFDRDEFARLSEDELNRLDEQIVTACCPDEPIDRSTFATRYDRWTHYRNPTWWDASYYRPDRFDTIARESVSTSSTPSLTPPSRDEIRADWDRTREREAVTAHAGDEADARTLRDTPASGDVSPHFGGRAQPGDVLGLETGGEETHVGDTSEDENERRRKAERDAKPRRD